jgi:hypothetical protein
MAKEGDFPDSEMDWKGKPAQRFAMELFGKIAEIWNLSIAEQSVILGLSEAAFLQMREGDHGTRASAEVLRRMAYILIIFEDLSILLSSQEAAHTWIRQPNNAELFCGASALTFILDGSEYSLVALHRYLSARRYSS